MFIDELIFPSYATLQRMTRELRERNDLPNADQQFLANIETHGWVVTKVFRRDGETGPDWAYSTGLFHSYSHAEIVIFGLDLDNMHTIVNNIGSEVKAGSHFESGNEYQGILARYGCQFRLVDTRYYRDYFGCSIWFYEADPFPVLQCFWPDREGYYPWDPKCDSGVAVLQPLLFKPS